MWVIRLLLGFTFVGVLLADPEEDIEECAKRLDFEEMEKEFSESDDLEFVCTAFMDTLDCIEDVVKEYLGVSLSELQKTAPPDSVVGRGATFFGNFRSLLSDICTEGTPLNTALAEHAECIDNLLDDDQCEEQAQVSYDTYKQLEDTVQYQAGDDDKRECMVTAYASACLAAEIHEKCGQGAFDAFVEIVKRSSIFQFALCSEDALEELKTEFVDSLDMESSQKDLFRLAFDLRRRKK